MNSGRFLELHLIAIGEDTAFIILALIKHFSLHDLNRVIPIDLIEWKRRMMTDRFENTLKIQEKSKDIYNFCKHVVDEQFDFNTVPMLSKKSSEICVVCLGYQDNGSDLERELINLMEIT